MDALHDKTINASIFASPSGDDAASDLGVRPWPAAMHSSPIPNRTAPRCRIAQPISRTRPMRVISWIGTPTGPAEPVDSRPTPPSVSLAEQAFVN